MSFVRLYPLCLYDRVMFMNANTKYVCIYNDSSITLCNDIDINAPVIFERTINPEIDRRIYVCIKVEDEQREPLVIN